MAILTTILDLISINQTWNEVPSNYRILVPQIIDNSIYEKLYKQGFSNFIGISFKVVWLKLALKFSDSL